MSRVAKKVAIRFAAEQGKWQTKLTQCLDGVRANPTWLVRAGVGGTAVFAVDVASLPGPEKLAQMYGSEGESDFAMAWVEASLHGHFLSDTGAKLREGSLHFADLVAAHAGGPRPLRVEMVAPVPLDTTIGMVVRVSGAWDAPVDGVAAQKLGDSLIQQALALPTLQAAMGRWEGRTLSTKTAGQVVVTVPKSPSDFPVREIQAGVASFATHAR